MADNNTEDKKAFVELRFGPNWSYISAVRNFIINFLAITLADKKRADIIAMAVNELVENAIKYSNMEGIDINLGVDKNEVIDVIVKNHSDESHVDNLLDIIAEIEREDPLSAYMKQMTKSVESKREDSHIGLARIRFESGADMSCTVSDGLVKIHARFTGNGEDTYV